MKNFRSFQFVSFIVVFLSIMSTVLAQNIPEQIEDEVTTIKIGAKVGYSLGKLSNSSSNIYTEDYESVSGIDFGFTAEFLLTDLISIQTEINFTQRGGKRTGLQPVTGNELSDQLNQFLPFIGLPLITNTNPLYADFENESDLKYLEVPVLVKFGFGNDFRFYGEIGPYAGILLKATQHTSGTSQFYFDSEAMNPVFVPNPNGNPPFIVLPAQSLDADTDVKDDLKTVNFGGIVGIGLIKKLTDKSELFLDARASYSFNTIQIKDIFGQSHVGGIIFSLGYAYTI